MLFCYLARSTLFPLSLSLWECVHLGSFPFVLVASKWYTAQWASTKITGSIYWSTVVACVVVVAVVESIIEFMLSGGRWMPLLVHALALCRRRRPDVPSISITFAVYQVIQFVWYFHSSFSVYFVWCAGAATAVAVVWSTVCDKTNDFFCESYVRYV